MKLMQMALVLDSILTRCPSEHATEIAALREKLSSGTTSDFRNLDASELSTLAIYLVILSTELARTASQTEAHEIVVPEDSEGSM